MHPHPEHCIQTDAIWAVTTALGKQCAECWWSGLVPAQKISKDRIQVMQNNFTLERILRGRAAPAATNCICMGEKQSLCCKCDTTGRRDRRERQKAQTAFCTASIGSGWEVAFAVLPFESTLPFAVLAEWLEAGGTTQTEISKSSGAQHRPCVLAWHTPAQPSVAAAAVGGKLMFLWDLGKTSDGIFCHRSPEEIEKSRLWSFRSYN